MSSTPDRRELSFANLNEVVAEAEHLSSGDVRTTGRHSFGQILEHLARTHDMVTGKLEAPPTPLFIRILMPFVKNSLIKNVKPGFKLSPDAQAFFWPEQEVEIPAALAHLKESVERFNTNGPLAKHPIFGKLSTEQATELNCKHCAMHLSFVHPV